jgi:hypothetical protein
MSFWDGTRWVEDKAPQPTPSRFRHVLGAAAEASLITVLTFGLIAGSAFAAKGNGHGGGHSGGCTANAPGVTVDNTWAWASWGSWGMPGQTLTYAIHVINYDVGCSSSSFVVSMAAPAGFSVSIPTNTITLKSNSSGYLSASVTSPNPVADGDYAMSVTVVRAGTSGPSGSFTTHYLVYSSDTAAPTLFWPNPADGETISGRSYNVVVSSNDGHAVQKIDLYIDDAYKSTTSCDDVAYTCQFYYQWSPASGQHTATFKSYDWMGNVAVLTVSFTVS